MLAATSDFTLNTFTTHSQGSVRSEELEESSGLVNLCGVCESPFKNPLILNCLHVFDRHCLANYEFCDSLALFVKCPKCEKISGSVKDLEPFDLAVFEQMDGVNSECEILKCSVCTEGKEAQFRCIQCVGTLCDRCRDTHKVMKLFSSHEVLDLTEQDKSNIYELNKAMQRAKPVACFNHPYELYCSFCLPCLVPVCKSCCEASHKNHSTLNLNEVPKYIASHVAQELTECRVNQDVLREASDSLNSALSELSISRDLNKAHIKELCDSWKSAIESIEEELFQKNREVHSDVEMKLMVRINQLRKNIDYMDFVSDFCSSYLRNCSVIQMCKLMKTVTACMEHLKMINFHSNLPSKIVFTKAPGDVRNYIRSHFGSFDLVSEEEHVPFYSDKSSSFFPVDEVNNALRNMDIKSQPKVDSFLAHSLQFDALPDGVDSPRHHVNSSTTPAVIQRHEPINVTNTSPWGDFSAYDGIASAYKTTAPSLNPIFINQENHCSNFGLQSPSTMGISCLDADSASMLLRPKISANYSASLYEYSRQRSARCSFMTLLGKWGSLGCELGRLNSPHGFCLGFDEEIVVADTYNHRIQIFTKLGEFLSFFGVSGRVDGLLWYPRKVAIIRQSQRYVVCDRGNDRSRMQLFSRSGHFVRRIQIKYIDIVAGLAINQHGQIVAIDSVTPSVFVMSEEGELIKWFDCSGHMKEPSDVAIHNREYYICDFKAHCVVVFQEDGSFIRTIGGESVTDFPNGIDVSDHGDVLVGDSHGNRFHIAVFSKNGELLSEFVCNQTKVSRSCCLKITSEGYVVTLARSSNNVLVMNTLYIS